MGDTYRNLEQYQKAIESHQQALVIYQELGDSHGEAISLNSLGVAYKSLGQYEKAIEYHQQALIIYQELGDSSEERLRQRNGVADSLGNLGDAYGSPVVMVITLGYDLGGSRFSAFVSHQICIKRYFLHPNIGRTTLTNQKKLK